MNGDLQKILNGVLDCGTRLIKLETLQKEQHKNNKEDIAEIKLLAKSWSSVQGQVTAQWFLITIIVIGLFGTAWATLK